MTELWSKAKEREFFFEALKNFAEPEQLFMLEMIIGTTRIGQNRTKAKRGHCKAEML